MNIGESLNLSYEIENAMDEIFKELLLKEYDRFADLMKQSESAGDTRLTFYMSLVTAVIGGIVALFANKSMDDIANFELISLLIPLSLSGLLMVGYVIFRRIEKRNETTDEYKKEIDKIAGLLAAAGNSENYNYKRGEFRKRWKLAGIKDTVLVINITIILFLILVEGFLVFQFYTENCCELKLAYKIVFWVVIALSSFMVIKHILYYLRYIQKAGISIFSDGAINK